MKIRALFYRIFLIGMVFCLPAQGVGAGVAEASPTSGVFPSSGEIKIQQSSPLETILVVTAPQFTLETIPSTSGNCQVVRASGWVSNAPAGQPALPSKGLLVGLPPRGEPSVSVELTGTQQVFDGVDLCPAAGIILQNNLTGEVQDFRETRIKDSSAYQSKREFPGKLAEIGPGGQIRSQRVGSLKIQPFQYNPVLKRLTVYRSLRVRIGFESFPNLAAASLIDEGAFESVLQNSLPNYETARSWRIPAQPQQSQISTAFQPGSTQPAYRITVTQDGVYRIRYADLLAAGIPSAALDSLDPRTLRLYNQGSEVSLRVEGNHPGVFSSQDSFLFYGQKNNTRYTDTNVYWLTWGGSVGQRIAESDGTPGSGFLSSASQRITRVEKNSIYLMKYGNGPDLDHWYWDLFMAYGVNASKSYTLNLSNVSGSPAPAAKLRGLLRDYSSSTPQHTRIYLNGVMLKEDTWPANSDYLFEAPVAQSLLVNGDNTIKVEIVLDSGVPLKLILVNWFEIVYTRDQAAQANLASFSGDSAGSWQYAVSGFTDGNLNAIDITDPLHPIWINNISTTLNDGQYSLDFQQQISARHAYMAFSTAAVLSPAGIQKAQPANLLAGTNGADYIIIAHPDFISALQPLADFHASRGLRTQIVNVQDIYDEFGGGIFDPTAIHDFLSYTYTHWTGPAPSYVLLVGDGNYDFKNYLGWNESNFIPPYLVDVDPWLGEVPADNRYVSVSGDDILPDMSIGRLPVKTASEASALVNKILDYAHSGWEDWMKKVLTVSDAVDPDAGNFVQSSDLAISFLPPDLTVDKIQYQITQPTPAETTAAIINAINDGRLIVNYIGHAAPSYWSQDKIFETSHIASLTNSNRPAFVVSMACSSGYFVYPPISGKDLSSLDEALARKATGGAIAAFSPVGFGLVEDHELLNQGLFQAIYQNQAYSFGNSTTQAKYFLFANTLGFQEMVDTYMLFGDPALQIRHRPFQVFVPGVNK